jgi:hypothetical protein
VQESELPALERGGEVLLQEGLLFRGTSRPVAVVELTVESDEVGSAPVEGVVALGTAVAVEGRWKLSRNAAPFLWSTSWLPSTGNMGTSSMRARYGAKKRLS